MGKLLEESKSPIKPAIPSNTADANKIILESMRIRALQIFLNRKARENDEKEKK